MRSHVVRRLLLAVTVLSAVLALPVTASAQEAALSGTVTDSTGGVLPGVTVTATLEATGNTFVAVTDGRGAYRIPVRIGAYQITAELPGFSTVSRTGVELLVGQTVIVNLQMAPSTLQETVTVTAEAPLIDVATSVVGGNIDSRQMQDLPVQGRDWLSLALLAPGNRTTTTGGSPAPDREELAEFQINVDGQQVTQGLMTGAMGQPFYSRDSIAEFQLISNRFDATQGRSAGLVVNAISKSGTNAFSGLFSSYFRNSDWNAKDHVLNRVLPYSNQQVSTAVGGPILRDRLHFFANYEYDRTPKTAIWNTVYPAFNISLSDLLVKHIGGARLDYQISPSTRLMGKVNYSKDTDPLFGATASSLQIGGGSASTQHPASTNTQVRTFQEDLAQLTQVLSNRALNEIRVGFSSATQVLGNRTNWSNHWQKNNGITAGHPRVQMVGFSIVGNENAPRVRDQNIYSVRDDFTFSYDARGRHDLKIGADFLFDQELTNNCRGCGGQIDARVSAIPPALMQAIFPDPFNVDTWNLAALSPFTRRYTLGISDDFGTPFNIPRTGAWVQDDWHISDRMTLNLGLRYDLITNAWANDAVVPPILEAGRPDDINNIQPRLGVAYTLNDRTVLRGGGGLYYGDVNSLMHMWTYSNQAVALIEINNDGRSDFAANPFNGPAPTGAQAFARFCDVNNRPGCLTRTLKELAPPPEYAKLQGTWQTSIGFQRQFGDVMAITADYVYNRSRNEKVFNDNVNLTYDAATGVNLPYSNASLRPYPLLGIIEVSPHMGWSNYHALQTALTKRFSDRWQGSVTYTVGGLWQADPNPMSGARIVNFPVAPDLASEYTLAKTDQRHRAVFNGIWEVGYGFQVGGIYFYGAGERWNETFGVDLRDVGAGSGSQRLRSDGTIIPRNNFVGDPVHRVDLRLQQRVPLGGTRALDGIFEVFNLFDRANYGSYTLNESSPAYRQPAQNANLAYGPRTLALGLRFTF